MSIEDVVLVERWVYQDLSSSIFDDQERERVLDAIDNLEEQLVVWDRNLTAATRILSGTGGETIYRDDPGDFRIYYMREGDVLYCIGVGKRKTTYDRDLDQIIERAKEQRDEPS